MEAVFLRVLNMSLTAGYVVAAVLLLRLLLRRAPKAYSYVLWSVVGFRLLCPFSFSSVLSLFNALSLPEQAVAGPSIDYISPNVGMAPVPAVSTGLPPVDAAIGAVLPPATPATSMNPMQGLLLLGAAVWILGVFLLVGYAALTLWRVHSQVETAVRGPDGVWESDAIRSPFILGFLRPRIYVPFGLGEGERAYVLAHERFHLRRRDHWVKALSFLLLAVHWFNPLVWLAFSCMARDMEMSCDEHVLAQGGAGLKRAYSTSLLSFAANRRMTVPSPLAFGETGVKARIQNVLRYKPARRGAAITAAVLCLALVAACVTNPVPEREDGGYERFGIKIPIPADYDGRVALADPETLTDDVLLAAYHIASQESSENGSWGGWMFSIVRHDYASFEDYWWSYEMSGGSNVFARDENYYYSYEFPTDVQFAPSLYDDHLALVQAFDLDAIVTANGLEPWTGSPWGDISQYTYPGNHWEFNGVTCTLILSQPVRQGDGGIWCVERWSDGNGNTILVLPDTDQSAQAYYEQLQSAVDAGETPLQTPYEVAADYISNVLGQPIEHLVGYELAEGAKGEAIRYLTQLFASGDPGIWYRDASGDSRYYQLSDPSPNMAGTPRENWYLSRYKNLFDCNWERLEEEVHPDTNAICLGLGSENCFIFYLGTEYVTLAAGEDRISYRTWGPPEVFGSNLPDYVLMDYSGYEIDRDNVSVPAVEGETIEEAMDRWLAAYREQLLNLIPESTYALTDMAVVDRRVYLTREGDDGVFAFELTMAVKPVVTEPTPWTAGNTEDGEGDWEGWMVMEHEVRLERIDGAWSCTDSGTGGVTLE